MISPIMDEMEKRMESEMEVCIVEGLLWFYMLHVNRLHDPKYLTA